METSGPPDHTEAARDARYPVAHSARPKHVSPLRAQMTMEPLMTTEPLLRLAAQGGVPGPRGFLPPYEPLRRLPPGFEAWEEIAADLSVRYPGGPDPAPISPGSRSLTRLPSGTVPRWSAP